MHKDSLLYRPLLESENDNFSFSGLKTSVLYFLKKNEEKLRDESFLGAVAHEFQEAVVDVLVEKTKRALQEFDPRTLVLAGGVSANVRLREQMENLVAGFPDTQFLMPPFQYSLDNASMIGAAALMRLSQMTEEEKEALQKNALTLEPNANLPLATPLS